MDLKWLLVPFSNRTKKVQAVQLWEVRLTSRQTEYSHDARPEMEAFTSESEANEFAAALENAVRLLRHGVKHSIKIEKGKSA